MGFAWQNSFSWSGRSESSMARAPAAMARMLRAPAGAAARAVDDALRPLHEKLFCQANPIPVKYALHRARGLATGIRPPLAPLEAEFHADVDAALAAADAVAVK